MVTLAGKSLPESHAHAPGHVPGGEMEAEIVKALTVGCYATAVEHCLSVHRYADALMIANTAGRDLYQRTMHKYMQKCPHPYQVRPRLVQRILRSLAGNTSPLNQRRYPRSLRLHPLCVTAQLLSQRPPTPPRLHHCTRAQAIIRANLEGDYSALIRTRPVAQWRDTLAMLVTYTDRDKFRGLADTLASRLAQAGMHHEASLCWVCGGHTDQAVSYWARNCTGASGTTTEVLQVSAAGSAVHLHQQYYAVLIGAAPSCPCKASEGRVTTPRVLLVCRGHLQNVIEKAVVMGMAPGVSTTSSSPDGVNKASQSLSELVTAYASLLASNGRMATALDYLEHVPGEVGAG